MYLVIARPLTSAVQVTYSSLFMGRQQSLETTTPGKMCLDMRAFQEKMMRGGQSYLVLGINHGLCNDHVFPSACRENNDFGDVIGGQRVTAPGIRYESVYSKSSSLT